VWRWITSEAEIVIIVEALATLRENAGLRRAKEKENQARAKVSSEANVAKARATDGAKDYRREVLAGDLQKVMAGKEAKRKGKASVASVGIAERRATGRMSARRTDRQWKLEVWRRSKR
jgi:hypothetical protein